jgi:hypothetical protein
MLSLAKDERRRAAAKATVIHDDTSRFAIKDRTIGSGSIVKDIAIIDARKLATLREVGSTVNN